MHAVCNYCSYILYFAGTVHVHVAREFTIHTIIVLNLANTIHCTYSVHQSVVAVELEQLASWSICTPPSRYLSCNNVDDNGKKLNDFYHVHLKSNDLMMCACASTKFLFGYPRIRICEVRICEDPLYLHYVLLNLSPFKSVHIFVFLLARVIKHTEKHVHVNLPVQ